MWYEEWFLSDSLLGRCTRQRWWSLDRGSLEWKVKPSLSLLYSKVLSTKWGSGGPERWSTLLTRAAQLVTETRNGYSTSCPGLLPIHPASNLIAGTPSWYEQLVRKGEEGRSWTLLNLLYSHLFIPGGSHVRIVWGGIKETFELK